MEEKDNVKKRRESPKVMVCLPTHNEADSIAIMVSEIQKLGFDIIITDSASTDGTIENANSLGIEIIQRKYGWGKGCGIREVIEVAEKRGYDIIVMIDCDGTYPVKTITQMLEFFPEYDMVIGARNMADVKVINRLVNYFYNWLINILFGGKLKDAHSGLRAFKINKFVNRLDAFHFDFEPQISCRALKWGYKIKEIPIPYANRIGNSKVKIWDGVVVLWAIIKERF